jgi:hypothetical protein
MNLGAPSCFANSGSGGPVTLIACPPGLRTVRDFSRFWQFRVLAACGRGDRGAEVLGELDGGRLQAAGAGVDEDLLARFQVGAVDQGLPGSQ